MSRIVRPFACLLLLAAVGAAPAHAQLPEEFTNLQILPADIETRNLVNVMRNFSMSLGVRCTHCHVGEEGQPFSEFDFASDDKPAKRKARYMMTMSREINGTLLAGLGDVADRSDPPVRVRCITCHRGVALPLQIGEVVGQAIAAGGGDAGVAKYRELREDYYGSGSYDFSEQPLIEIGSGLGDDPDAALAIFGLALEYYPESVQALVGTAQVHMGQENNDAAREALLRAQELDPNNRQITQMLGRLGG